ncbi:hypothetical protein CAEBREN_08314 [Caenorhabditis brenneri]|uniref:Uncharacterized protein n=1 Tax=Caenorhabditis brenneri TaxID=135651 RepID=G0MW97_CAEBE|nr:hypothetical protein CAEBREN_08314 [Caenorhabditis brenneri]
MKVVFILQLLTAMIFKRSDVALPAADQNIDPDFFPEYICAKNQAGGDGTPELEKQPFCDSQLTKKVILPSSKMPRKDHCW